MYRRGSPCPVQMSGMTAVFFLFLLPALLLGCQPSGPSVDHMVIAKELMEKIKSEKGVEDFSDAAYEEVSLELQLVPSSSPDKAEADDLLKKIREARRAKLWTVPVQEGGSYPSKPSATARASSRSGSKGAPPGWNSYSANIDLNAIKSRVSGGAASAAGLAPAPRARSSSSHSSSVSSSPTSYSGVHITIYTASWCGVCKAAKAYMSQKGISYTEKDIEKDPGAKAEAASKTGGNTNVPIIDVNGQIMVGFEKSALQRMIQKAKAG